MNSHNDQSNSEQIADPKISDVLKLIWSTLKTFYNERPGQIIGSAFLLIMIWGYHGNLELLKLVIPDWSDPGVDIGKRVPILSFAPWDRELISFWGGAALLVFIPMLIIKFGFKQKLSDYGLGLPPKGKRAFAVTVFFTLTLLCLIPFYIG
ncbi:MAG TPA: hypothetical protein PKD83_14540, partial [Ignavibacteria bacterium]|nr:hypothetical protein [Ignavibacteria bacterium]